MTGASLGYSGAYVATLLDAVGKSGFWWSSAINTSRESIFMKVRDNGIINPRDDNNKYPGRAVRCHTTQSEPVALITVIRLNQACIIYIQVVTTGATNYTRWPVVASHRLGVKHTRIPVIVARIDIRQWIAPSISASTRIILIPIGSE